MPSPGSREAVLITGTTSGVGQALAELCRKQNYTVIAVNRRDVADDDSHVVNCRCDITSLEDVQRLVKSLADANILPRIWFLNAGVNEADNVERLDLNVFNRVLNINLYGSLSFIQAIQEMNLKNQVIVGISSTSSIVPNAGSLGYYISKLSLLKLFEVFNRVDGENLYKIVILGPTVTNLNRTLPAMHGLQKAIFSFLSLTSTEAAAKIMMFAGNSRKTLHPSFKSRIFYCLLSLALKVVPGIYYKPYPASREESHV